MTPPVVVEGVPDRGDVVWLEFDPQAGREQASRRPAVVLSPASYNAPTGRALCVAVTMCIRVERIEDQGARSSHACGGEHLTHVTREVEGACHERDSLPGQRARKRRIRPDRCVKVAVRIGEDGTAITGHLHAAQILLVRLRIAGSCAQRGVAEPQLELPGNRLHKQFLRAEHVTGILLKRVLPEYAPILRVAQFGRHAAARRERQSTDPSRPMSAECTTYRHGAQVDA